ncbi:MAG: DNA gyrase C-terminal beta-propeller domain-containing protein, partial [Pseudomonadota bacterium]
GAMVLGRSGIAAAYATGRGSILMRARVHTETTRNDRQALVATEIPYQVNKSSLIEKIAELVREKRVEGIADIRDESDRDGYRVVIELKKDANSDVVLNQLYRFTQLQTSFGVNMVALNGGKPEQMNLIDLLSAFTSFREEVVQKRTKFLLRKARDRAHVLVGLAIAVANIDEVIALIRHAPDPATARSQLMERRWPAGDVAALVELISDPRHGLNEDQTYNLSEAQARAILELRLQRLTALGRDEIADELNTIGAEIKEYLDILASRVRILEIVKNELVEIREEYATPRRTELVDGGSDMDDEDLIAREDMVVTVSHGGYIKRVPLSTYRAQRRGGKGRSGMATREDDFVNRLFVLNTHTPVLFFSSRGIVYKLKVWRLPLAQPQSRGKALVNILPLEQGERITTIMPLPEAESAAAELEIMFATRKGTIRRNSLADFVQVNRNGKIAMKLDDEDDAIIGVDIARSDQDVLLATAMGQAIRFSVADLRVFASRNSTGVRGINLAEGDRVISMCILDGFAATTEDRDAYMKLSRQLRGDEEDAGGTPDYSLLVGGEERFREMAEAEQFLLGLSRNGYGKRSSTFEYRRSGRGGKGITAMAVNDRNGDLVGTFPVEESDEIMLVSNGGKLIRVPVSGIRIAGRATQGVTVFSTAENEEVVSVERVSDAAEDDTPEELENVMPLKPEVPGAAETEGEDS